MIRALALSLLLTTAAHADTIDDAAFLAAQEYVCAYADFDASEAALQAVVAEGIPEDIAVEIIADLAWDIVASVDPSEFCGVMVAGGFEP